MRLGIDFPTIRGNHTLTMKSSPDLTRSQSITLGAGAGFGGWGIALLISNLTHQPSLSTQSWLIASAFTVILATAAVLARRQILAARLRG